MKGAGGGEFGPAGKAFILLEFFGAAILTLQHEISTVFFAYVLQVCLLYTAKCGCILLSLS